MFHPRTTEVKVLSVVELGKGTRVVSDLWKFEN